MSSIESRSQDQSNVQGASQAGASNPVTDIAKMENETFVTQRGGKM